MIRLTSTTALLLALFGTLTFAQNRGDTSQGNSENKALLDGFDEYVLRIMDAWHIPGLAVGVVHEGEVISVKAIGQRDLEREFPVTTETLFPIGSITKSFTAAGLGMLVDEGKLDWDEPVRRYLPDFRLHDEWVGSRVTIRDLLTHQTGVPRHGTIWWGEQQWLDEHVDRRDVLRALVHLHPTAGLRQQYQYSNENYIVAGLLFEAVADKTWEEFTQQRILDPLGMTSTHLHVRDVDPANNLAHGHYDLTGDGKFSRFGFHDEATGYYGGRAVGPAGSIVSNIPDMLKWLQFHLDHGRQGGQQLLSVESANELVRPLVQLPDVDPPEHVGGFYGMGFQVFADSARKKWVQHAGLLSNCTSFIGFMPAEKSGVVILTNWTDGFGSYLPLQAMGIDLKRRFLGQSHQDIIQRFRKIDVAERERFREKIHTLEARRRTGTTPTHPLDEYTGTYYHPTLQTLDVYLQEGELEFRFHGRTGTLSHYHYDTFVVKLARGTYLTTFHYDRTGQIDRMLINLEPDLDDFEFLRTGPSHVGNPGQTAN